MQKKVTKQIDQYFAGKRKKFRLRKLPAGTPFQQRVWKEIKKIPYGQTITYKELAKKIGKPTAVRAVANACNANQLPLVIPCHRVVQSDGSIGGYSGGEEIKSFLLNLERSLV